MNFINFFGLIFAIKSINGSDIWPHDDLINPLTHHSFCKVSSNYKQYVCDPEKLLSSKMKNEIEETLLDIRLNSPCICNCNEHHNGLELGIMVLSEIRRSQRKCKGLDTYIECFARNIMQQWNMSSCGNDAIIIIESNNRLSKAHIYFGRKVHATLSTICKKRIIRDVEQSLTSILRLQIIMNRINLFVMRDSYCRQIADIDEVKWEFRAEILLGLIIAFSFVTIILIFVVPCCKRRNLTLNNSRQRNSNIVRPMHQITINQSELPPDYFDITKITRKYNSKRQPEVILVDSNVVGHEPPSYSDVMRCTKSQS